MEINRLEKQADFIAPYFAAAAIIIFLFLKVSYLTMPFFWDEIVVYALPAQELYEKGLLHAHPSFRSNYALFFGHPPAHSFTLAILFKLFEATPFVARAFSLFCSTLGLFSIYAIVGKLTRAWLGFLALVLLAFDQNYFFQSSQVLADVLMMGLIPLLIYLSLTSRFYLYVLVGSYLVLVKESSLIVIVAVPLAQLLAGCKLSKKELIAYATPLLVLILFFVNEKIFTGKFSNWPEIGNNSVKSISEYFYNLIFQCGYMITSRLNRSRFAVVIVSGLIYLVGAKIYAHLNHKKFQNPPWVLWCALFTIAFLFLGTALIPNVNEHYFLPLIAPLLIAAFYFLHLLFKRYLWLFTLFVIFFIYSVQMPMYARRPPTIGNMFEGQTNHIDLIRLNQESILFLEENFQNATVNAAWPIYTSINNPFMGYVKKPIQAVSPLDAESFDVLFLADASSPVEYKLQEKLIEEKNMRLYKEFSLSGQKNRIYVSKDWKGATTHE